jgi:hypothetical protein
MLGRGLFRTLPGEVQNEVICDVAEFHSIIENI